MSNKLTEEELIKIGVNLKNITESGEMNIIVQCFGSKDGMVEDYETGEILPVNKMYPDIYQPRKNRVYSYGCSNNSIPFETDEEKKEWIKHLKDSAERLKIMAYYLMKQAEEIEKFGYPKTDCYYPE